MIKVLESMRHETRPPTLHVDDTLGALDDSPFRVLAAAEPWDRTDTSDGVLRAGVSAFGFGGNNAHLLLEEPRTASQLVESTDEIESAASYASAPIAIVGLGVVAARAVGWPAFRDSIVSDTPRLDTDGTGRLADIELRLAAQKFPPNDLKAALAQQLAMLQVTDEALAATNTLPTGTTGIYVGMGTDPEAARFGTRWRVGADDSEPDRSAARDMVGPPLTAAGVLGTMPNLVANRLNSQYDIAGPSFTLSGEEHSGLDALRVAVRTLRSGDIDAALVGAVDLSCDPVHVAARSRALADDRQPPGDAAVMLVVKRLDDAERDGDTVFALVCEPPADQHGDPSDPAAVSDLQMGSGVDARSIDHLFGRSHAASGLLHVAGAATLLHHRVSIGDVPLIASNPGAGSGLPTGRRAANGLRRERGDGWHRSTLGPPRRSHRTQRSESRRATPAAHLLGR